MLPVFVIGGSGSTGADRSAVLRVVDRDSCGVQSSGHEKDLRAVLDAPSLKIGNEWSRFPRSEERF